MAEAEHLLYGELAAWWPLLSPPEDYEEEAEDLLPLLLEGGSQGARLELLELGSGGGSLAHHLKARFELTLSDRSPEMLAVSRAVNPECAHVEGDMRTMRLGRAFDRVLIHDAIMYALDEVSVRAALRTADVHCRRGGRIVVMPDCVKETFEPATEHSGRDGEDGRAMRCLETWDPDAADDTCEMVFAFVLREADGSVRAVLDRHKFGCFSRERWRQWFEELGLRVHCDPWKRELLVAEEG